MTLNSYSFLYPLADSNEGNNLDSSDAERMRLARYLVYFAAERTLMAWVRAALGLMALGFVIDRFGLVVQAMALQSGVSFLSTRFSFVAGAGLVAVGALMAVVAAVRYIRFARRYHQSGDTDPGYGLSPAIAFTIIISLAGAIIAGYLMTVAK